MYRKALSARRRSAILPILALACLVPVACLEKDSTGTDDGRGNFGTSITATVVAVDMSQPAGVPGVSGTITFGGLTVELWDGESWHLLTDQPGTATVALGDGATEATLATTEIPAGDYTKARLAASQAEIAVSALLDGREYSAEFEAATAGPVVIEKDVEVIINDDGSRTFRFELVTIGAIALEEDPVTGTMLTIDGDLGQAAASANMSASLQLSDVSAPEGVDDLSGTVRFENLAVELWDGEVWILVTDEPTTAEVAIAGGEAEATVIDLDHVPPGVYTKARLTADQAVVDVDLRQDGRDIIATIVPADGEIVVEKDVEVIVENGATTFKFTLVAIQAAQLETPGMRLVASGDLGNLAGPASMGAGLTAADVSSPEGASIGGTVSFTGLTIELSQDAESWLLVAEESGTAEVALGDGTAEATLMPVDDIPAGTYYYVRLTVTEAVVDISAELDGQSYEAQIKPPSEDPLVIEKEIEAEVKDGTTTFRMELECVRTISVDHDPGTGDAIIHVEGDLGVTQTRVS